MKIIILGAGAVGTTLAEKLVDEHIDVTVVDDWSERLNKLQDRFDIKVVHGVASHPDVLRSAGAEDCDLLIAVTVSDEVNMVACQVAYSMFRTPVRIARIRSAAYAQAALFSDKHIPIDITISPETLVTDQISRLISHPGALRMWDFASGRVCLVETVISAKSLWIGQPLAALNLLLFDTHEARIVALYRSGTVLSLAVDISLEEGDEVLFVSTENTVNNVLSELRTPERPHKRITIAGGGHVGELLALSLEQRYSVKLIETDGARCRHLAESLQKTIVLHGSATEVDLLYGENVPESDVFCATTNNDEINVMSSMLAKQMGVAKTVAIVNKPQYVEMFPLGKKTIDIVFSPRQTTISTMLSYIRRGDIVRAQAVHSAIAEAVEVVAHGHQAASDVIGRTINELNLPEDVTFCALVRDEKVTFASSFTPNGEAIRIAEGDHLVLFVADKKRVREVEHMFQLRTVAF